MSKQANRMSFRVTICAGPRTKIKASADAMNVNEKHFKLANEAIVSSTSIETFIKESLETALKELAGEETTSMTHTNAESAAPRVKS